MELHKLTIETDGTIDGTTIKIGDDIIAGVQELTLSIKADPISTVQSTLKYWRVIGTTIPLTVEELKNSLVSAYGVYSTPYTGRLEQVTDILVFTPEI